MTTFTIIPLLLLLLTTLTTRSTMYADIAALNTHVSQHKFAACTNSARGERKRCWRRRVRLGGWLSHDICPRPARRFSFSGNQPKGEEWRQKPALPWIEKKIGWYEASEWAPMGISCPTRIDGCWNQTHDQRDDNSKWFNLIINWYYFSMYAHRTVHRGMKIREDSRGLGCCRGSYSVRSPCERSTL